METKRNKRKWTVLGVALVAALTIFSGSIVTFAANGDTAAASVVASEITQAKAKEIALATVGGGTVTKCTTDYENGRKVYEITIIYGDKKYEMDVDTITSVVTDYKVETIYQNSNSASSSSASQSAGTSSSTSSSGVTAEKAKEVALATVGGGTVTKCEIEYENGRKVYDITIVFGDKKYEMDVDTITAEVTNYEFEAIKQGSSSTSSSSSSSTSSAVQSKPSSSSSVNSSGITAERAKEIALAKVGGGNITKCETDYENSRKEYDITIVHGNYKYEIEIDAANGTIVKYETESIRSSSGTNYSSSSGSGYRNYRDDDDDHDYDDHDDYDDYDDDDDDD